MKLFLDEVKRCAQFTTNPEAQVCLDSIEHPLRVLVVYGEARLGKSSLANGIVSKLSSASSPPPPPFKTGHTTLPVTKGADAIVVHGEGEERTVVVDAEGSEDEERGADAAERSVELLLRCVSLSKTVVWLVESLGHSELTRLAQVFTSVLRPAHRAQIIFAVRGHLMGSMEGMVEEWLRAKEDGKDEERKAVREFADCVAVQWPHIEGEELDRLREGMESGVLSDATDELVKVWKGELEEGSTVAARIRALQEKLETDGVGDFADVEGARKRCALEREKVVKSECETEAKLKKIACDAKAAMEALALHDTRAACTNPSSPASSNAASIKALREALDSLASRFASELQLSLDEHRLTILRLLPDTSAEVHATSNGSMKAAMERIQAEIEQMLRECLAELEALEELLFAKAEREKREHEERERKKKQELQESCMLQAFLDVVRLCGAIRPGSSNTSEWNAIRNTCHHLLNRVPHTFANLENLFATLIQRFSTIHPGCDNTSEWAHIRSVCNQLKTQRGKVPIHTRMATLFRLLAGIRPGRDNISEWNAIRDCSTRSLHRIR